METTIKFNGEFQTATIDGKQYKLVEIVPEQKEPKFSDIYQKTSDRVIERRRKVDTFYKLVATAQYLCPNFKPDWSNAVQNKVGITKGEGRLIIETHQEYSTGTELFDSRESAQRAIDIFRANGDEQELIDFLTK